MPYFLERLFRSALPASLLIIPCAVALPQDAGGARTERVETQRRRSAPTTTKAKKSTTKKRKKPTIDDRSRKSPSKLASTSPETDAKKSAAKTPAKTPAKTQGAPKAAPEPEEPSLWQRFKGFVRARRFWVIGGVAVALGGSLTWFLLSGRRRRRAEFLEPLDSELAESGVSGSAADGRKYSSTQIRASDVNARLGGGTVGGTKIETDREYALVVDQEALATGEVDKHTGYTFAQDVDIRRSLNEGDFESAYSEYTHRVQEDGSLEFRVDVERALSEHFLRNRDFGKAARILEHHVATHAREDIESEVYFNLGYIHVLTKTYNKSRRYFRLFIRTESNPEYVARARGILETIGADPDRPTS